MVKCSTRFVSKRLDKWWQIVTIWKTKNEWQQVLSHALSNPFSLTKLTLIFNPHHKQVRPILRWIPVGNALTYMYGWPKIALTENSQRKDKRITINHIVMVKTTIKGVNQWRLFEGRSCTILLVDVNFVVALYYSIVVYGFVKFIVVL